MKHELHDKETLKSIFDAYFAAHNNDGCDKIEITEYCTGCKHEKFCRAFIEIKEVIYG